MNSIAVDFPSSLECNLAAFKDIQGGLFGFRLVNGAEIEHLATISVSFHWQQQFSVTKGSNVSVVGNKDDLTPFWSAARAPLR
jgi:hypothetical protein